jgi:cell wall-associated NlpC family hydrolase
LIKFEHLTAREFDEQSQNCFHLLRELYMDNWGIELSDIPCPVDYYEQRMNLYAPIAESEGFFPLHCHPREYLPGDVFLMAIGSPYGNHVAVLLDDGQIVHHLYGQLSTVTPYGGMFRNTTIGVYRHKDVPINNDPTDQVDFRELLSPVWQERLAKMEEASLSPPELLTDISSTPES